MQIHFEAARGFSGPIDLIVEPYWTMGTKDRLVGISLDEDERTLANALGVAGIIAISFAAWLFSRREVRPRR